MAEAGVNGVVTADVLNNLSNDTVLTTAWMDGAYPLPPLLLSLLIC